MNKDLFVYLKGIYSLGSGTPFYKHSKTDEVPWPHIMHPLANASLSVLQDWERVIGKENLKQELENISQTKIDEGNYQLDVLSTNIHKPRRTTYTTRLPYYKLSLTNGCIRLLDPDVVGKQGVYLPGKCIIHEIRLITPISYRVGEVKLWIGGRLAQTFKNLEGGLLTMMQEYLGCKHVFTEGDMKITTLPLYISRDHAYGLPLFVPGDILLEVEGGDNIQILVDLEIIHTREEVKQITRNHILQVEVINKEKEWKTANKWLYLPVCWREVEMKDYEKIYLDYEGGRDEEIRGVFWDIVEEGEREVTISIGYEFDMERMFFVDSLPQSLVSRMELFGRILPSMSGGSMTPGSTRFGGFLFSKYVDQLDCEPGVTPRNGKLFIEFERKIESLRIYLLTSKDLTL